MILARESILQAQVLTYCEDPEESILYIAQATTRYIDWIYLKDHHCEDCFSESSQKKDEPKPNLLSSSISKVLAQYFSRASGRSILSRRKNNVNMLQTSLTRAYSELVSGEKARPALNYEIKMEDKFSKMVAQQMSMRGSQAAARRTGVNISQGIVDKLGEKFSGALFPELAGEENKNHILVLDQQGKLVKIKTHSLSAEKMERMMLLLYVRSQMHYLFVFRVSNSEGAQRMSSYIFVRKTLEEMERVFRGNILFTTLIDDYAEVLLLRSPTRLEPLFFESV